MELIETVELMQNVNYKQRFLAEYYQLKIRIEKLEAMVNKWDKGELDFIPTCNREIYDDQLYYMRGYLNILKDRAEIEGIELKE